MKSLKLFTLFILLSAPFFLMAQVQVTYGLRYDEPTQKYIVSMQSNTAYTGALARISSSVQFTIVAPHVTGGWQATSLTGLQAGATPASYSASQVNAPAENPSKDYLFFTISNATSYTPFTIPANTSIDLFSFSSGSGCIGDLYLFDNTSDPLLANLSINSKNNIVILGAGSGNKYIGNTTGNVPCFTCAAEAGSLNY